MRKIVLLFMTASIFFSCSKDEKCPDQTCAHKAARDIYGGILYGKDCPNKAEPCKNYCWEHRGEEK